jgi:signal transduction histidine kinase
MRFRRPGTVRARLTALAALTVLAVLVVAGVLLVAQQRNVLTEALDEGLGQRAVELQALRDDVPATLTGLGEDDTMAQVVVDGVVVASSPNVAGLDPVVTRSRPGERITTVDGLPHEDSRFRLVSLASDDGRRVVLVAGSLDDIDESVATLSRSLLALVPAVAIGVGVLVWWLVGRTLGPVEAIRAEVAHIGGSDRSRRVPVPSGDDEVARLARTMNDMLQRMEDVSRRQQQFLADASHELRSPLTRMRAGLEVDLAHQGDADLVATHRSVLEEAVGLQRLAEDLLLVAREDAGAGLAGEELVALGELVGQVARRLPARDGVRLDLAGVEPAQVRGDRDALARALGNLADNAVRHAATTVWWTLTAQDGTATLAVVDDGPGVPEADRERIFERFARVDEARSAGAGGAGLGLAIARDIVERHGGHLVLAPETGHDGAATASGRGARFVVTLPLA